LKRGIYINGEQSKREFAGETEKAVKSTGWLYIKEALEQSRKLLEDTLVGEEEAVVQGIDLAITRTQISLKMRMLRLTRFSRSRIW
jgi:hypothetical protein